MKLQIGEGESEYTLPLLVPNTSAPWYCDAESGLPYDENDQSGCPLPVSSAYTLPSSEPNATTMPLGVWYKTGSVFTAPPVAAFQFRLPPVLTE
ncbi:Uncharacterised protein [uncultured archaeon]|nr:Uncharacterised protein [uncultured archaeon]